MNRKHYLIFLITSFLLIPCIQMSAQLFDVDSIPTDYLLDVDFDDDYLFENDSITEILPEAMDVDWEKLFEGWHASYFYNQENYCEDGDTNPFFSDSIYRERLSRMPTIIPMVYNESVRKQIDFYAAKYRKSMRFVLGMADYFFPMLEQILDRYDMPLELKYLTVIESALNPVALSPKGASGLWQFMLPTGKGFGLEINSLIDERRDPIKATEAACKYLKQLYNMYDDWYLALAAYNCGPGGVNKAIARSGGKKDYWKILSYLPSESRTYVAKYIATAYVMTYHCDHNICPVRSSFAVATDTIMVDRILHIDQLAEIMHIDKEIIRFYNPHYKREIIYGNVQPSVLRLPIEKTIDFIDQEDTIYAHRVFELLEYCIPVDITNPKNRQELISHTVKANENLNTIAHHYGVAIQELRKWNGLSGTRVAQGRKLRVYIDNGGLTYSAPNTASTTTPTTQKATVTASQKATTTTTQQKPATTNTFSNASGYVNYTVKNGDSLYAIALKYPGVTVQKIQQANGMTTTKLMPGQMLKIPL